MYLDATMLFKTLRYSIEVLDKHRYNVSRVQDMSEKLVEVGVDNIRGIVAPIFIQPHFNGLEKKRNVCQVRGFKLHSTVMNVCDNSRGYTHCIAACYN